VAETALTELQNQIEAIRRDAFAEGYAAAMKTVHELTARSVPLQTGNAAAPNGNGRAEDQTPQLQPHQIPQSEPNKAAVPLRTSNPRRRSPAKRPTVRRAATGTRRSRRHRAKRGANAQMIQEILKKAPRAVRQADIRNALQRKGVSLSFPSIRHALGQLEARRAARQIGKTNTWPYSAA